MRSEVVTHVVVAASLLGVATLGALALTRLSAAVSASGAESGPGPSTTHARGVTLTSVSFDLPDAAASYPNGPHVNVMNTHCLTCHSASMITNQPRLPADQWTSEVNKMRTTYKATVDDKDVPDIVDYLTSISAKIPITTGAGLVVAKDPASKVMHADATSG